MMQIDRNALRLTLLALIAIAALLLFDGMVRDYVNAHDACRPFFDAITDIGLGKWYTWPTGIVAVIGFALWRAKKLSPQWARIWLLDVQIFLSVAGAGLFTDVLKRVFARVRPYEFYKTGESGFFHWSEAFGAHPYHFHSFPSGHTTTMFALATAIALMLPQKHRAARITVFVFAGIIGASRIMVLAHYPSDVVAGMLVGAWGAVLVKRALQKWRPAVNLAA